MILMTVKVIKVLLALVTILGIVALLQQKLPRKALLLLSILTIIVAAASNWVAGRLPPLTDEVTLTALGVQSSEAKSSEVYLDGYTIDGTSSVSGTSLEIVEGHWFWSGETYAWRPETDSRKPDGMTRTVVLQIPVGWLRTLNFNGNPYRGSVEISTGGNSWTIDTYSENSSTIPIEIGRSETSVLVLNQLRCLAIYVALLLIWIGGVVLSVRAILRSPESANAWLQCHTGKLVYLGIAIVTFLLMFHYSSRFSLWLDEMYQISFVKDSLSEAFLCCLRLWECSPPLALMCSAVWYRIAPHGEQWLLLISMLLTALSIYIMGLIGEKVKNVYCGILASTLAALSTAMWLNAAYQFRAYPYLVAFSTLTSYLYIRKNEEGRKQGWAIAFSVSMTCMAMSHYFGMLACACYFCGDFFLWSKKQVRWKESFLYVLPGICSAIWLAAVAIYQGRSFTSSLQWYGGPTIAGVQGLLKFLTGDVELCYWILLLGVADSIVYGLHRKKENKSEFKWSVFYQEIFSVKIVGVVLALFVYGAYINTKSTLWSERYFLFLLPDVFALSAMALCDLTEWIAEKNTGPSVQKVIAIFIGIFLSINCLGFISSATSQSLDAVRNSATTRVSEPYREAADWLYRQSNHIFNDTTVIIMTRDDFVTAGWIEYYVTRQGRRDGLNIVGQASLSPEEVLQYDRIYVHFRWSAAPWLQTLLNENYTMVEDNYSSVRIRTYVRK